MDGIDTKRRAAQGSYNRLETPSRTSDSALTLSENINPNVSGISASAGRKRVPLAPLSPSSSQKATPRTTVTHENGNIDSQLRKPLAATCSTSVKNGHPNFLSPSQRRLSNVDLSGLSYQSPASRLIKKPTLMTTGKIPFHLPASTLSANKAPYTNDINPRLFDAFNQDRGRQDMRPPNYSSRRTQFDPRITETPESAQKNENSRRVTVNIPDIDELDIPRPVWFPKTSSEQTKSRGASSSGVKNLMNNFNAARDDFNDINLTDNALVSDDDATEHDDRSHHRGEYLSDDEIDLNLDMSDVWKGYMDLGKPTKVCQKCKARMWNEERNNKSSKNNVPTFSICCKDGQVQLPKERPPPPLLASLLSGGEKTKHYMKNIRTYNSLFQFTSMGGKIDRKLNNGGVPYCFKLNGQNYHYIGSLKPKEGETPKFCQLYVYDTENEIQNRMNAVPGSDQLDPEIIEGLLRMLDDENKLAEGF